jgi:hypothetical protein
MMASTLPFLFAQLPLLPGHIANGPQGALAGCIFATLGLFSYSAYQVTISTHLEDSWFSVSNHSFLPNSGNLQV